MRRNQDTPPIALENIAGTGWSQCRMTARQRDFAAAAAPARKFPAHAPESKFGATQQNGERQGGVNDDPAGHLVWFGTAMPRQAGCAGQAP